MNELTKIEDWLKGLTAHEKQWLYDLFHRHYENPLKPDPPQPENADDDPPPPKPPRQQ